MMRKVYMLFCVLALLFGVSLWTFLSSEVALAVVSDADRFVSDQQPGNTAFASSAQTPQPKIPTVRHVKPTPSVPAHLETPQWPYPEPPVLVNAWHTLDKSWVPDKLVEIGNTYYRASPSTADAVLKLMQAAEDEGLTLHILSAYRSFSTQKVLYDRKTLQLQPQFGALAVDEAARIVARPGASEHQLGLAIDISDNFQLLQSFGETKAGRWLAQNANRFGFILRYPKDKTDITGIIYEPWHIRYVGEETARVLFENDWCLEEYWALFDQSGASLSE